MLCASSASIKTGNHQAQRSTRSSMPPRNVHAASTAAVLGQANDDGEPNNSSSQAGNETMTKKKKQTCLHEVPLIELALENVSYAPVVVQFSSGGSRKRKKNPDKKRVTILHNITTKISPYKLSAVMGPRDVPPRRTPSWCRLSLSKRKSEYILIPSRLHSCPRCVCAVAVARPR